MSNLTVPIQTNNTNNSTLELENIFKEYTNKKNKIHTKHVIINILNLEIKKGEFVAIVGPSGCGKSTLLNLVARLDEVFDGEIQVDDKPIAQSPSTDRVVVF